MIDCTTTLDLMLEADLDDLRGTTASELSRHLAHCAACRARAASLLAATERLRDRLAQPSRHTAAQASGAALNAARASARRRRLWWSAAPLAAAAALALLFTSPSGPRHPPQGPDALAPAPGPAAPIVHAATARNVIVMKTDNPKIVVVWLN